MNYYSATEVAKKLNLKSAQDLNNRLAEKKIIYKEKYNGRVYWYLEKPYTDKGYAIYSEVESERPLRPYIHWTDRGVEFIDNILNDKPITASVEKPKMALHHYVRYGLKCIQLCPYDTIDEDHLGITEDERKEFVKDCYGSFFYQTYKKTGVDTRDSRAYNKWYKRIYE